MSLLSRLTPERHQCETDAAVFGIVIVMCVNQEAFGNMLLDFLRLHFLSNCFMMMMIEKGMNGKSVLLSHQQSLRLSCINSSDGLIQLLPVIYSIHKQAWDTRRDTHPLSCGLFKQCFSR